MKTLCSPLFKVGQKLNRHFSPDVKYIVTSIEYDAWDYQWTYKCNAIGKYDYRSVVTIAESELYN